MDHTNAPQGRYIFTFDTYVAIRADTKEQAEAVLEELEADITATGSSLIVFDAYGIEDAETGDEIRQVG